MRTVLKTENFPCLKLNPLQVVVQVFKSVWQHYAPTPETSWLLEQFRGMLNYCIRIGLAGNVTSLKALSPKANNQFSRYDVASYYKLCAISAATGISRNYRKAKRKNPYVKEPYARRLRLTTCYGFKLRDGELSLPIHAKEHVLISLNQHVQATINGFALRSATLTEDRLSLAYTNKVQQLQPCADKLTETKSLVDISARPPSGAENVRVHVSNQKLIHNE
jgi:hypothetical protein